MTGVRIYCANFRGFLATRGANYSKLKNRTKIFWYKKIPAFYLGILYCYGFLQRQQEARV